MTGIAKTLRIVLFALVLAPLAACTEQIRSHGYTPSEEDLQQIVVGVDTRASVEDVIGVPTTSGVLNASGFYYIQSDVRHFAYRRPEVVNREVLSVSFDPDGVVTNIERYGLQDGNVVPLTRRITRTDTGDISFVRKLFGNIGGFTAADLLN